MAKGQAKDQEVPSAQSRYEQEARARVLAYLQGVDRSRQVQLMLQVREWADPDERKWIEARKRNFGAAQMGLVLFIVRLSYGLDPVALEALPRCAEIIERCALAPPAIPELPRVPEFECAMTADEVDRLRQRLVAELLARGLLGGVISTFQSGPDDWAVAWLMHSWAGHDVPDSAEPSNSIVNTWRAITRVLELVPNLRSVLGIRQAA